MLTRDLIERLASLRSEAGIVTAYVRLDPQTAYAAGQASSKFKSAYSRALREADAWAREVLERERGRIVGYLEGWKAEGGAIAIFSSTPDEIWEVVPLAVQVPSWVSAARAPDVTFLARIVDEYPRLAVVLLDGGDVRIYLTERGSAQRESRIKNWLPNRHDQGGWSQARYQRHVEFHRESHLREVADKLQEIKHSEGFDRLVLVGVETATKELQTLLPAAVQRLVIGHLPADFKQASDEQLLPRALEIAADHERRTEVALVQEIVDNARAGGRGATGLGATTAAVIAGNVEVLAVADGVTAEGSACPDCDYLSAERPDVCPVCGSPGVEPDPNIVATLIERALLAKGRVEIVFDEAAEMLTSVGGIGALLRYPAPAPAG